MPPDEPREAFVLELEDTVHVCPVQSRLRSWVALSELRDGLPEPVLQAFVPPVSLQRADADHQRWGDDEAGSALRILTATWSVPVQWFVPFGPVDRMVDLSGDHPTVAHRTRMSAARRRVARALRTVQTSPLGELDVLDGLEEPRGVVADTSVADVAGAVAALAEGDDQAATSRYVAVVDRWAAVAALERAN